MANFSDAYPRYERLAFAVISRFVRNPETCEELTQDTFLKVHRSLEYYDPSQRLSTWVGIIANNTAIDYLKSFAAVPLEEYPEPLASTLPSPEDEAIRAGWCREIAELIRPLPRSQQRVLWAMAIHDLSNEETAERLGITVRAVQSLKHRAMLKLRGTN